MAFQYLQTFGHTELGTPITYVIWFDIDTLAFEVFTTPSGSGYYTVTEFERGYTSGAEMYFLCDGTTQYLFKAKLTYPYAEYEIHENATACGYAPPCDLSISSVDVIDESVSGAHDGYIKINATSSAVPIMYSLDNVTFQAGNEYFDLHSGFYIIYVKDANGCLQGMGATVAAGSTPPTPAPDYPWEDKSCHYFKLYQLDNGNRINETTIREPIGWDAVGITGKRDMTWHGYNFQYSDGDIELKFDCPAGKALIETVFDSDGQDGAIYFEYGFTNIDSNTYSLFDGKLDLNTYKVFIGYVSATVQRKDFNDLLQSRFDTKVDMSQTETMDGDPILAPITYPLTLHSKALIQQNVINDNNNYQSDLLTVVSGGHSYGQFETDNPSSTEIQNSFGYPIGVSEVPIPTDLKYVLDVEEEGDFDITINYQTVFLILLGSTRTFRFRFVFSVNGNYLYDSGSDVTQSCVLGTFNNVAVNGSYSTSLHLIKGDKVYYYMDVMIDSGGATAYQMQMSQTVLQQTISSLNSVAASDSNVWFLDDAINHCLGVTTNRQSRLKSTYIQRMNPQQAFDGSFSLYALINGYGIRNFGANQPLKISLKDLLVSTQALGAIGFGFEDTNTGEVVRVEKIEYFYQEKEIIAIDETADYHEEVAKELIWNELEIGYETYKSDGLNVLDEFNTVQDYLTPIKTYKNKYSQKSSLIASGYSIEDSRRQQFAETPTTSFDNDENGFIISVKRDGLVYDTEKNESFDVVNNVISPSTSYNLRISPKRSLLNHGKWIRGAMAYKSDSEIIRNTFYDKNGLLQTQFSASEPFLNGDYARGLWQEKGDLTLLQLADEVIYRPEWVFVTTRLTPTEVSTINKAMRGGYGASKDYGYIMVKKPDGTWQALWLFELKYNYATERADLKGLKKYTSPSEPDSEPCCSWLVANGCKLQLNGQNALVDA